MNNFTIGYLSYKKHDIFKKTLESHKKNGLFDIISSENRLIFFQELSDNEISIANQYNCRYIGDKNNIGILNAYIKMVEECKTEYFIFCENDFLLLDKQNDYSLLKCFQDLEILLKENYFSQIKLSNVKNPGFLYCYPKNKKEWLSISQDNFPYKIESFSWIDNPKQFYNISTVQKNYEWYIVDFKDQRWSNHIYVSNTDFLKKVILPLLKFNRDTNQQLDIRYQGLEDTLCYPEKIKGKNEEIDKIIEKFKNLKIISGGGNFFHNRV